LLQERDSDLVYTPYIEDQWSQIDCLITQDENQLTAECVDGDNGRMKSVLEENGKPVSQESEGYVDTNHERTGEN
jgi:hypothetical protein